MAFRLLDQLPQYRKADGTLCALGTLTFSITGTSTAKAVFGEPALSTNLGAVITLDADARHSEDVWLAEDAAYRVILKDSGGATIWTRDNVRALDQSLAVDLPDAADGDAGDTLKTDGTSGGWYFEADESLPSQTGNSGKYLTTDGSALSWVTPEVYDDDNLPGGVTQTSTSFRIGNLLVQFGSGTLPVNASGQSSSVAVTFGTAFTSSLLHVDINLTGAAGQSPSGAKATVSYVANGLTGFTAYGFIGDEHDDPPGYDFDNTGPFTYVAYGLMS